VTRGAAFGAAVLVTIGRPAWWLFALATFLLRGGIVVAVLPIITLPSALALSNAFAPILLPLALGRVEPGIVVGPAAVVAGLLVWLVVGGRIAAGIDVALVREVAAAALDEGVDPGSPSGGSGGSGGSVPGADAIPGRRRPGVGWRVLALRLIAWLPLALALGIGLARIVEVTYVELTRPVDVATPIAIRVAREVVSQLGLIVIAWVAGEVVGGVATRHVALSRGGHRGSLQWALGTTVSSPLSWIVPWLATTTVLFAVMGAALAASGFAWMRAVDALADRPMDPAAVVATMLVFVVLWLSAMLLGGVVLAVRSASQTFEHVRRGAVRITEPAPLDAALDRAADGTFGASAQRRPGDWSAPDQGGSL
jgi:hypothetical protein